MWQTVLDVVDAVESWIAGQSYWVQVVMLLAVLGPLCYLLAGLIDRAGGGGAGLASEPGHRAGDRRHRSSSGAAAIEPPPAAGVPAGG